MKRARVYACTLTGSYQLLLAGQVRTFGVEVPQSSGAQLLGTLRLCGSSGAGAQQQCAQERAQQPGAVHGGDAHVVRSRIRLRLRRCTQLLSAGSTWCPSCCSCVEPAVSHPVESQQLSNGLLVTWSSLNYSLLVIRSNPCFPVEELVIQAAESFSLLVLL